MANRDDQKNNRSQQGGGQNNAQMDSMSREELLAKAREMGLSVRDNMSKEELVQIMRQNQG